VLSKTLGIGHDLIVRFEIGERMFAKKGEHSPNHS
jgi:hypothetical protein